MYEILFQDEHIKSLFNQSHHGEAGMQPRALAGAVHAYADNIDRHLYYSNSKNEMLTCVNRSAFTPKNRKKFCRYEKSAETKSETNQFPAMALSLSGRFKVIRLCRRAIRPFCRNRVNTRKLGNAIFADRCCSRASPE
jgi:hypothetical protein